ncbi:unnamed protein product [Peniophora sp. CBMAI 1063]|nr:unnamed protein product [Peniophora sp. CBMAI 1063]
MHHHRPPPLASTSQPLIGMTSAQNLQLDVLKEIFEYLAAISEPRWRNEGSSTRFDLGWIYAAHVCRRWRDVGLDLAQLWAAHVCSLPNVHASEDLLKRTKSCPLKIEVLYGRTQLPRIHFALRNLDRVESITCYPSYDWEEALRERGRLPLLRHLHLSQDIAYDPATLILDAPLLQTVSLENAIMMPSPSSAISYSSLRSLSITGVNSSPTPAWEILTLLSRTPHLQHLYLQLLRRHSNGNGQWEHYNGKPVHLAHLETVRLIGGWKTDVAGFWSHIRAPGDVDADFSFQRDSPVGIMEALSCQLPSTMHDTCTIIIEPQLERQAVSFSSSNITPAGHRSQVKINFGTRGIEEILSLLSRRPQMDRIRSCVLRLSQPRFSNIELVLVTFIRKLPSVTNLLLDMGDRGSFDPFIHHLVDPETTTIIFPKLRTLSVRFNPDVIRGDPGLLYVEWWSSLCDMLARRSDAGMKLKELRLVGQWSWTAEEVATVDGELMSALRDSSSVEELVDERSWRPSLVDSSTPTVSVH